MTGPKQTNRAFGLTFTGVFLIFSTVWWLATGEILEWALAVAGVLFVVALVRPGLLLPLNLLWQKLARRIALVNSRIILGLIFFLVITPIGLLMRVFGRDPMARSIGSKAPDDYWTPVRRQADSKTLGDQF